MLGVWAVSYTHLDVYKRQELTERAQINRKTFYLHYNSLDDLLAELQDEICLLYTSRCV